MAPANYSAYLSATKLVLLVAVEQYARHYDWGPAALSDIAELLVGQLCEPSWTGGVGELCRQLGRIHIQYEGGRTLGQMVAGRLLQLDTVDELHGFFDGLARLVVDAAEAQMQPDDEATLLDSESVFGVFVRRCCLAFDQLEFHQVGQLFEDARSTARVVAGQDPPGPVARSRLELQEHIEHLVGVLEAEAQAPVAAEMETRVRQMAAQLPDHSRLHYLNYLNLVRAGESEQSAQALRRVFDSSQSSHLGYQYALLFLAAMHVQLGMYAGAQRALTEATHVARDCQDHACLLFIVCWESRLLLARLQQASAPADRRGLARQARTAAAALIDKARAMGNSELQTAGHLQLAELQLVSVRATTAAVA
ncbi:APC5 protein [Coemansia sp. RSA 552]|nr:APC5 protein [Coemansia sp. RSA 552]